MQCWISRFALRLIDSNAKNSPRYWSSARQPNSRNLRAKYHFSPTQQHWYCTVPSQEQQSRPIFLFCTKQKQRPVWRRRNARHPNEKKTAETTTAKLFRPLPVLPRSSISTLLLSKEKKSRKFCTQGYIERIQLSSLLRPSPSRFFFCAVQF